MENESQPKGAALTRIGELRRRRKLRHIRKVLLIALLAVGLLIYFTGVWRKAFTAAGDLADNIQIAFSPEPGWPARTGIPEIIQLEPLSGGFAELGQRDLVIYSPGGRRLRSIQHGYARPAFSAGNGRLCLYNRSGNELRIESRTRSLDIKEFDQPILLAEMSQNGSVAVVTGSRQGLAELTVLDPTMKFRYGFNLTEETGMPSRIAFAADNRRFAVACLTADNGSLSTNLYFLDTRSSDIVANVTVSGSQVLDMHWINEESLLVIYRGMAAVYDAANGEEKAVFSYGGRPLAASSVCGQNTALLFSQPMTDAPARLVVLDPGMQVLADVQVPSPAQKVVCTRTKVYVLRKTSVAAYTLAGEWLWETQLDAPVLAVLDAKEPLVFTGGEAAALEEPNET